MRKTWRKMMAALLAVVMVLSVLPYVPEGILGNLGKVFAEGETTVTPEKPSAGDGTEESPYEISSAAELYWFAGLVNGTLTDGTPQNLDACGKLTKDIIVNEKVLDENGELVSDTGKLIQWEPMGKENTVNTYTGKFNGNGHTISGLYHSSEDAYIGLFGNVCDATIENVGVTGSYFSSTKSGTSTGHGIIVGRIMNSTGSGSISGCFVTDSVNKSNSNWVAGICGLAYVKIEKCYNSAIIEGGGKFTGGICGQTTKNINDCYNSGKIAGTGEAAGGIFGSIKSSTANVNRCYNTGQVTGEGEKISCSPIGIHIDGTTRFYNCFYLITETEEDTENTTNVTGKTEKQFASGEVAYLLSQGTYGEVWGQTLTGDEKQDYPVLGGKLVYRTNGCITYTNDSALDNTTKEHIWQEIVTEEALAEDATCQEPAKYYKSCQDCGEVNKDGETFTSGEKGSHTYNENGFCTLCDGYEPAEKKEETNSETGEIYSYYAIGNAGQLYWFAEFTNISENAGKNINGRLTADIIVNEKVLDDNGELVSDTENLKEWEPIGGGNFYAGAFDGDNHIIRGLYINREVESNTKGGFISSLGWNVYGNGSVQNLGIEDSYFRINASEDVEITAGGICGEMSYYENNITNSYYQGVVEANSGNGGTVYAGGIAGMQIGGCIENCYQAGTVSGTAGTANVDGICDYVAGEVKNCYKQDGKENSWAKKMSEEQFASGEVAYLLAQGNNGEVWGQNLTADKWDKYPVLGGAKVYATTGCVSYTNVVNPGEKSHNFSTNKVKCSECGQYEKAEWDEENNQYKISNASQLYWFAALVNGTLPDSMEVKNNVNAILTADIVVNEAVLDENGDLITEGETGKELLQWIPIGAYGYKGTFNGGGYTISGLYTETEDDKCGFIKSLYGRVENLGIKDSYFKATNNKPGSLSIGGICGMLWDKGTINNCYNQGSIVINVNEAYNTYAGGICGYLDGNSVETICNSYNQGKIEVEKAQYASVGGICGYSRDNAVVTICNSYNQGKIEVEKAQYANVGGISPYICEGITIKNCYSMGRIEKGSVENFFAGEIAVQNLGNITNSYYLDTVLSGNEQEMAGTTAKTSAQFVSGEVAYLLGQGEDGDVWGQTLTEDGKQHYPVLGGQKVYATTGCIVYSNDKKIDGIKKKHTFTENKVLCSVCGQYEKAEWDEENNQYKISNASQLYWFAALVNGTLTDGMKQNDSANAILTADIKVNDKVLDENGDLITEGEAGKELLQWIPIEGEFGYRGTFDGDGHTISGLYTETEDSVCGFIKALYGRVENLGIKDSYFKATNEDYSGVSIGGICGEMNDGTIINNCYNQGSIVANAQYGATVGGICGYLFGGTISNSYNLGKLEVEKAQLANVGGIAPFARETTIKNCYSVGRIEKGSVEYFSAWGIADQSLGNITNSYYLDTVLSGNVSDNEQEVSGTAAKTSAQFASGEVAYLLGQGEDGDAWGQTLTGDGKQDYPVLGGQKVYATTGCVIYTNTENPGERVHTFVNGKCTACGSFQNGIGEHLAGYTVSLWGNIGVNFYMELSEEVIKNNEAYMKFTLPDGTEKKVYVGEVFKDTTLKEGVTYYVFSCGVASYEMTGTIKARMYDGNGNWGEEYTFTVKEYAEYILKHPELYSDAEINLVKSMLNYGSYAQTYFKVAEDNLANESLSAEDKVIPEVDLAELEKYDRSPQNNEATCSFLGINLVLGSETTLKIYFKPAEGLNVRDLNFTDFVTYGGAEWKIGEAGDIYVLRIENIEAWNLGCTFAVSVSDSNMDNVSTLECSVMTYCYNVLKDTSGTYSNELKNLLSALRAYQLASEEYVESLYVE